MGDGFTLQACWSNPLKNPPPRLRTGGQHRDLLAYLVPPAAGKRRQQPSFVHQLADEAVGRRGTADRRAVLFRSITILAAAAAGSMYGAVRRTAHRGLGPGGAQHARQPLAEAAGGEWTGPVPEADLRASPGDDAFVRYQNRARRHPVGQTRRRCAAPADVLGPARHAPPAALLVVEAFKTSATRWPRCARPSISCRYYAPPSQPLAPMPARRPAKATSCA